MSFLSKLFSQSSSKATGGASREIIYAAHQGDFAKVELLLKNDPALALSKEDASGATLLHFAAVNDDLNMARLLLAHHVDVNARTNTGETPLAVAVNNGFKNLTELLLAHGADVNASNDLGLTPLHSAAESGGKDILELLLAHNADVNRKDKSGGTPLHFAAVEGHKDVAALLLANFADIEAKTRAGWTALHIAAASGQKEMAALLLSNQADINAKDIKDQTPLQVALANDRKETAELLRQHDGHESPSLRKAATLPAAEAGFQKPYAKPEINFLYNLLFCDDIALFRNDSTVKGNGLWPTLLAETPNLKTLRAIAENEKKESRIRAIAYNRLRASGQAIPPGKLLAVIVEVPLEQGLDVLAAFADGRVRYLNQSGKVIVFEEGGDPQVEALAKELVSVSQSVVEGILPWNQKRLPPPSQGMVRVTFLASDGLHLHEGTFDSLQKDAKFGPVLAKTRQLLEFAVETALNRNEPQQGASADAPRD